MPDRIDLLTGIAQKRGFFWPTAEIYGGQAGFYTYGHLGKLLKLKFENLWRRYFLSLNDNFFEIESNAILPEPVFRASGHVENFNDPLTECKACHFRFRADQFLEDKRIAAEGMTETQMTTEIAKNKFKCPRCGGQLSEVRWFNMMFPVKVGFTDNVNSYLSPETAQAAYLVFKSEFEATRKKLPLGIAIIGKAYRNEISPRQMFFRLREFTQAELQIFFDSAEIDNIEESSWSEIKKYKLLLYPVSERKKGNVIEMTTEETNKKLKLPKFYVYHMAKVQQFYLDILKVPKERFRLRELSEEERAFYNKFHWDVELKIDSLGDFKEFGGIHYRTDHDLAGHQKISKQNLEIFWNNKKLIPHVLELSFGVDRNIWAILDLFYRTEKVKEEERNIFGFPAIIAPIQVAIFPLVNKDGLPEIAKKIYVDLKENFSASYDESGSIGRMYRRQDEIGTPFCITVDYDTKKDKAVTLRERDSMKQKRIKISELKEELRKLI